MSNAKRSRLKSAIEAAVFTVLRAKAVDLARWLSIRMGRELFELPVAKTAYIGFGVTLAALAWVKISGERWADYGLKSMKSGWRLAAAAVSLIVVALTYSVVLEPIVDAFVVEKFGGSPTQAASVFSDVVGDLSLYLYVLPFIWVFAAFGEEFFYRGFLMTKIAQVLGDTRVAWAGAVIVQALIFGAAHSYQGPVGVVGTGVMGLIYGAATVIFGRCLWPAIIAHGAINTLGFTLLYLGLLETG